jgi:hypothetical protein
MKDGLIVSYIEVVLKMDFSNSLKQLLILLSGLRWSPRLQAAIATDIVERVERVLWIKERKRKRSY